MSACRRTRLQAQHVRRLQQRLRRVAPVRLVDEPLIKALAVQSPDPFEGVRREEQGDVGHFAGSQTPGDRQLDGPVELLGRPDRFELPDRHRREPAFRLAATATAVQDDLP